MWQLDGTNARLETPQLNCEMDLASPASGLRAIRATLESKQTFCAAPSAIMQLTLPSKATLLADAYIRGNDLVATYEESADRPCRTQVYWRIECESDFFGIQLIVSVQTSILDAAPSLTVATQLPGRARLVAEGIVIVPLPDSNLCYVEVADGSNVESTIVRDNSQITNKLFPGSLEKGVIRRARILGGFLPAHSAERTARTLRDQFVCSSPPLTT
jgi:hypothetical protein